MCGVEGRREGRKEGACARTYTHLRLNGAPLEGLGTNLYYDFPRAENHYHIRSGIRKREEGEEGDGRNEFRGNGEGYRRQERKRDVGDREPQREQESKRAGQRKSGERQRKRP